MWGAVTHFTGASRESKPLSMHMAATSRAIEQRGVDSSTITMRPVFSSDVRSVASSSGESVRKSITSALVLAPASASAAFKAIPKVAPKPTSDSTMQAIGEDGTISTEPTSWTMLRGLFWLKLEGGPTLRLERTDPRKEQAIREVVQMGFDEAAVRAMQASLAGEPSAEALVEALLSQ